MALSRKYGRWAENEAPPELKPKRKRWLPLVSAILCILVSLPMWFFSMYVLSVEDFSVYRTQERLWTLASSILFVFPLGASILSIARRSSTSDAMRVWTRRLLVYAIVAMVVLGIQGVRWSIGAEERGGDWVGLDIIVAYVFGVFPSVVAAFLCALQLPAVLRDDVIPEEPSAPLQG